MVSRRALMRGSPLLVGRGHDLPCPTSSVRQARTISGCPNLVLVRTLPRMATRVPTRVPYRPLPVDQTDVVYGHGPDSVRHDGVPQGQTVELRIDDSAVYPGTSRTVWVHVPAAYDPDARTNATRSTTPSTTAT
ncbi:hypothetical protein GCM10009868_00420 [Terrabacter aerolatus]